MSYQSLLSISSEADLLNNAQNLLINKNNDYFCQQIISPQTLPFHQ
jgi:hypothetical protein